MLVHPTRTWASGLECLALLVLVLFWFFISDSLNQPASTFCFLISSISIRQPTSTTNAHCKYYPWYTYVPMYAISTRITNSLSAWKSSLQLFASSLLFVYAEFAYWWTAKPCPCLFCFLLYMTARYYSGLLAFALSFSLSVCLSSCINIMGGQKRKQCSSTCGLYSHVHLHVLYLYVEETRTNFAQRPAALFSWSECSFPKKNEKGESS